MDSPVSEVVDFAEAPLSLAEARASRSQRASDWTPRDALIELLRQIDRGDFKVDQLVMAYRLTEPDGGTRTTFSAAVPDLLTSLGLLQRGAYLIQARAEQC